jgi:histidyl-tRNA synthetase
MVSKKVVPRKLKGFQDYAPEVMSRRLMIIQTARQIAQRAGFYEIATPALEYAEVLLGVGGETDKQVFRFQDGGERDVAMRYDLTVPFARYAAENFGQLSLPFKRLQIGDVWRAEKPQKGRFREFCQCDIDIIGVDTLSADVEILVTVFDMLNRIIKVPFTISCNNRKLLSFLLHKILGIHNPDSEQQALILLDKLDKQGKDSVAQQLSEKLEVSSILAYEFIETMHSFQHNDIASMGKLFHESSIQEEWKRFYETIKIVQDITGQGHGKLVINLSIARGLAYYTGIVYETTVDGVQGFGSVCSGGRYDNLAERFIDQKLPGVGISIGVDRLTALLTEKEGLQNKAPAEVYIAIASQEATAHAFKLAHDLREKGIATDLALREQKLGAQFKNADKRGFPWVIALGSDEMNKQCYPLKNMKTGVEHKDLSVEQLISILSISTP